MIVPEVKEDLTVQLPAWNALYQIRDFAYRVQNVRASDDRSHRHEDCQARNGADQHHFDDGLARGGPGRARMRW